MRILAMVLVSLLLRPDAVAAQAPAADSVAVLQVLQRRSQAMRSGNAELQREMFSPDAVWINAFGRRRTGPDSIVAFLGGLYADPGFRESRLRREDPPEIRFIRPDVAIVHDYHERDGQRLADGSVIGTRRIHTTLVLSKQGGRWLVRYQFIGDERERASPQPR